MTSTRKYNGKKRRSTVSHIDEVAVKVNKSEPLLVENQPSTSTSQRVTRGRKRALSLTSPSRAPKSKRAMYLKNTFQYEENSKHCSSDSEIYGDENELSWDEPSSSVENRLFRANAYELDEKRLPNYQPPSQLTQQSTRGLGSPSKIWNLMVRVDEIVRPSASLLDKHEAIKPNMRSVLVDWMMEVCETEKQHRETFHLAVDYVDRFLNSTEDVSIEQFQLIGTTALFIASKYEEIYPPKLEDFVQYTDNACSDIDVRKMEILLLKCLQWTLSPITSIHWLGAFMQLLGKKEIPKKLGEEHISDHPCVVPDFMRDDFVHMAKILDMCLLDVRTLTFSYREVAASVMYSCLEPQQLIQQITGYTYEQLLSTIEWVEPFVRFCDRKRILGDPLPQLDGINPDNLHNIQTHSMYDAVEEATIEIDRDRKDLEYKKRQMRLAGKRAVLRARIRV